MAELDKLNKEIEEILTSSDEANKYVKRHFYRKMIFKSIKWWIITIAICSAIYYVPILNWNASAIGRILMIKWILPIYDWTHLYNARCFIDAFENQIVDSSESSYIDSNSENCAVCENIDKIDRIPNITYDILQNHYLFRDVPVILTDSHRPWPNRENISHNFIDFLHSNKRLMDSIPCNAVTNLFQTQHHSSKLRGLFKQIDSTFEWFMHFRNCDFDAVKATRTIFPYKYRPKFISPHLPPYRSSWLLLSHDYVMLRTKKLIVKDTAFVFQLSGRIIGELIVQNDCIDVCLNQEFELNAGETLVFNTRMWNFYYRPMSDSKTDLHATFIQEIETD